MYIQYRTPAITAQVYELIADRETAALVRRLRRRDRHGRRTPAASASSSARTSGGVAHLTWYDDDASVFAYADAADSDRDGLLAWWRTDG